MLFVQVKDITEAVFHAVPKKHHLNCGFSLVAFHEKTQQEQTFHLLAEVYNMYIINTWMLNLGCLSGLVLHVPTFLPSYIHVHTCTVHVHACSTLATFSVLHIHVHVHECTCTCTLPCIYTCMYMYILNAHVYVHVHLHTVCLLQYSLKFCCIFCFSFADYCLHVYQLFALKRWLSLFVENIWLKCT